MATGGQVVIIDGYNVVHGVPELAQFLPDRLAQARRALVAFCAGWLAVRGDVSRFVVVFDGESRGANEAGGRPRVDVVFTRSGETADARVIAILDRENARRAIVVSADAEVSRQAQQRGAQVLTPPAFYRMPHRTADTRAASAGTGKGLTPAEERAINEDLRRAWGIDR